MEGIEYLVALSHFQHFGPRRLKWLFNYFGSWEKAWSASGHDLSHIGLKNNLVEKFIEFRQKTKIETLLNYIQDHDIKLLDLEDKLYPSLLKEIYAPPPLLYYRGQLNAQSFTLPLAVVGSRKITNYGKHVCQNLVRELVNNNLTIISGLALGIDALAHEIALDNNGQTIAFLGCGVEQIYPRENHKLGEKILAQNGLLISEFPPQTIPFKTNFPRRNRLIAGASLGVLVIEAGEKSGALITARYGLEENREIFAIPGPICNKNSLGTNNLIKLGAKLISESKDITNSLGLEEFKLKQQNKTLLPSSPDETLILKNLDVANCHINELVKSTGLDINVINSRLTIMEMKGLVKHLGNMQYIKLVSKK